MSDSDISYMEASAKRKRRNQFISIVIVVAILLVGVIVWGWTELEKRRNAERIKSALNSQMERSFTEMQAPAAEGGEPYIEPVPEPAPADEDEPGTEAGRREGSQPKPAPEPEADAPRRAAKPPAAEKPGSGPSPPPSRKQPPKEEEKEAIVPPKPAEAEQKAMEPPKPVEPERKAMEPPKPAEPQRKAMVPPDPPREEKRAATVPPEAPKEEERVAMVPPEPPEPKPAQEPKAAPEPMEPEPEEPEVTRRKLAEIPESMDVPPETDGGESEQFRMGLAAYRQKDFHNAAKAFGSIPKPPTKKRGNPQRDEYVRANFFRALAMQRSGRLSEAASAYNEVLDYERYHPVANMNLGICYIELKQYTKAHRAFESVVRDQSFIESGMFDEVMQRTKYYWALTWTRMYRVEKDAEKRNFFRQQAVLKWKDYLVWFSKNENFKKDNIRAENYLKSLGTT